MLDRLRRVRFARSRLDGSLDPWTARQSVAVKVAIVPLLPELTLTPRGRLHDPLAGERARYFQVALLVCGCWSAADIAGQPRRAWRRRLGGNLRPEAYLR